MDSSPAGSVNKSIAQDTLTAAKSAPGKFRVDQGRSGFPSGPAQSPDDGVVDEHRHFIGRYGNR